MNLHGTNTILINPESVYSLSTIATAQPSERWRGLKCTIPDKLAPPGGGNGMQCLGMMYRQAGGGKTVRVSSVQSLFHRPQLAE